MGVLVGAIVVLVIFNFTVYCDILTECEGVESETYLSDSSDCESYIYCDNEDSFVSKCPNNQRFNEEIGTCDDPENVECLSVETSTTQTTLRSSTDKSSTEKKPTTREIVSSTKTSSSISQTSSSSNLYELTSSFTSAPSSSTTNVITATSLNAPIICPTPSKPEEVIYFPNSQSCSEYFICFSKTPIPMTCPKGLEFNSLTSSCVWASLSNCKVAGSTTTSPRELCSGNKLGYFEYSNNCHYYYRCLNGMLTIQECPFGFGWDTTNKMCSSTACRRGI